MNDTQLFVDLCLAKMASRRGGSVVAENKAADAIYRRFGMVRSVMADAAKLAATALCYEAGIYVGDAPPYVMEALAQVTLSHPDAVSAARAAMALPSVQKIIETISLAAADRGVHVEVVNIEHTTEHGSNSIASTSVCKHCGRDTAADLRAVENMQRRDVRGGER